MHPTLNSRADSAIRQPGVLARARRLVQVLSSTRHCAQTLMRADRQSKLTLEMRQQVLLDWGSAIMKIMHVEVTQLGTPSSEPCLFVGNHMSYVDIPLLDSLVPVVFIAKKELASWPIFGHAMRSVGTVFVDRSSVTSRRDAAEAIGPYLVKTRQSVAVFPSGTTRLVEDKPWRYGAFVIAKRFQIPLQPFRLRYDSPRRVAYIDDDAFGFHLWQLLGAPLIRAEVEFGPLVQVSDPEAEARRWWQWSREKLENPN